MAFALLLASCGSSDPKALVKEGYAALGSGQSDVALAKFDEALTALRPEDQQYLDANMCALEALIASDPVRARERFLALSQACPDKVGEKEFLYLSDRFAGARKFDSAFALLDACKQRAGSESAALVAMRDRLKKQSEIPEKVKTGLELNPYLK